MSDFQREIFKHSQYTVSPDDPFANYAISVINDVIKEANFKIKKQRKKAKRWKHKYLALRSSKSIWTPVDKKLPEKEGNYLV